MEHFNIQEKVNDNKTNFTKFKKMVFYKEWEDLQKSRKQFLEALLKFQAEVPEIPRDKIAITPDGRKYRYASLDKIMATIRPYLTKNGLICRFETFFEDKDIIVECIIQHVSGYSESTLFKIPVDSSAHLTEIQKYGSSLTYAKRYSLCLALGIMTEDDTDDQIYSNFTKNVKSDFLTGNVSDKSQSETEEINEEDFEPEKIFGENFEESFEETFENIDNQLYANSVSATETTSTTENKATKAQIGKIISLLPNTNRNDQLKIVSDIINKPITRFDDLSKKEASTVINELLKRNEVEPF